MKKNKLRSLKINGVVRYILTILASAALIILAVYVFVFIFQDFTLSLMRAVFGRFTDVLIEYAIFIIIAGFFVVVFIISVYFLVKAYRYIDIIHRAVGKLTKESDDIGEFPEELKSIEVELKDLQHSIFRNEQLAREAEQRKNDLVVYLAHDLKTPLTSIIGYLSLLSEAPELPTEQKAKYVGIALDKAYRLESLINEFFDITRFNLQSIVLERNRVDLSLMLLQMADEFYPVAAQKGLEIKTQINQDIKITADADKLARVFDNLVRNAISYSYEGTPILIAASSLENEAVVVVRNKGDEIPGEKLSQIFGKFFRLDNARGTGSGGAGLGLAIVKQLVELHGGVVEVKSGAEYTDFVVRLPHLQY